MTRSRTDTVKKHSYTLLDWWYSRGPWTQIFILAGLLCAFELLILWVAYPWLERMVTT